MKEPCLPEKGFIRLKIVLQLIPVSRSAWYAGQKSGIFPMPVKLGKRTSAYKVEDIRTLIDAINSGKLLVLYS